MLYLYYTSPNHAGYYSNFLVSCGVFVLEIVDISNAVLKRELLLFKFIILNISVGEFFHKISFALLVCPS